MIEISSDQFSGKDGKSLVNLPVNLDDYRPHVTVQGLKAVHIIPVTMLKKIILGELKVEDIEDLDDFLPKIVSGWFSSLNGTV